MPKYDIGQREGVQRERERLGDRKAKYISVEASLTCGAPPPNIIPYLTQG